MPFFRFRAPLLQLSAALAATAAGLPQAQAQQGTWPDHPVKVIVPFVAGGPTDLQARWAAQKLTDALGQPFIVENRGAAGGAPATLYVAKSPADGYTLLVANPGPLTVGPQLKPTGYTWKDLAPILLIAKTPSCLGVRASLPVQDFHAFAALAKDKPGQVSYGSPGIGTAGHLMTELLSAQAKIRLNHIPYRGAAQVTTDLIGGTIDSTIMQMGTCVPLVRQGKVRALAVTSKARAPQLPDVPTLAESGLAGFDVYNWNGLLAPKGTPPAIVNRITAVLSKELATTEAQKWLDEQAYQPSGETGTAFAAFLDNETKRWGKVIKDSNIKAAD